VAPRGDVDLVEQRHFVLEAGREGECGSA
jgi:hypothetical protein